MNNENSSFGRPEVRELPPYRAILVVDLKGFSEFPGSDHDTLTRLVPEILGQVFLRCGRPDVWDRAAFGASTGDGRAVGFDPAVLPLLLHPFLGELQEELADQNRIGHLTRGRPLRMRVSLHVGPMTDSGANREDDGSGLARIAAHRLLDSAPARQLLDDSNPETTLVAAIVSQRVFEDVVLGGYTSLDEGSFVPAQATVKGFNEVAYLYAPKPSGLLLRQGFPRALPPASPQPIPPPAEDEDGGGDNGGGTDRGRSTRPSGVVVPGNRGAVHFGQGHQVVGDNRGSTFGDWNIGGGR